MDHDHLIYAFGLALRHVPAGARGVGVPLPGSRSSFFYGGLKLSFTDDELISADVSVHLPGGSALEPFLGSSLVRDLRNFVEPSEYPLDAIPYGLHDRPRYPSRGLTLPPIPPLGDPGSDAPTAAAPPPIQPMAPAVVAHPDPVEDWPRQDAGVQVYLWGAPPPEPRKRGGGRGRLPVHR